MEILKHTIVEAILQINPKAVVSIEDDDIKKIKWLEGTTPISEADKLFINALEKEVSKQSFKMFLQSIFLISIKE